MPWVRSGLAGRLTDNTDMEQLLEGVVNIQCLLSACDVVLVFTLSSQLRGWHLEKTE